MKISKLLSLVLSLCFLAGCTEKETQVEVSSVSLNTATIEMVEGETFSLVATVLPKDAEYDGVTWASSNASVASVNSGTVTAIKEGTATITASAGGKSATCTVKVSTKVVAVTSITLDKTSLSMQVGETETITATVSPYNATDKTITWNSSDVSVATVADGKVTAKKSGTAIITAKSGTYTADCTVTITVNTESVTIDKTSLELAVGETAQLTATVKPDDATDKNVIWTTSDESVAKVADGKVSAVKIGLTTITAKCGDKTAECAVTVIVPVSSVIIDKTALSLAVGKTAQLTATIKPDNATDKDVIWFSSDENVAKVTEEGNVSAINAGNATITAKCGGMTAECAVTVTVPTLSIKLDQTFVSLLVGECVKLYLTITPSNSTDSITWKSETPSIVTVDNGVVKAVAEGTGKISVHSGQLSEVCEIAVISTSPNGVDLGLSVKWATTNLGANTPAESGDYYAWGEVSSKSTFYWENYKWGNGGNLNLKKYVNDNSYGYVDNRSRLAREDDAAVCILGGKWRMPTKEEIEELHKNTNWTFAKLGVMNGYVITSKLNGKCIFLPMVGMQKWSDGIACFNSSGFYWSSDLYRNPMDAWRLCFSNSSNFSVENCYRFVGLPIRPVNGEASEIQLTSISLNIKKISLYIGDTETLSVSLIPSDATHIDLSWSSSNPSVATVSAGVITAISEGSTEIKVMNGNVEDVCTVNVLNKIPVGAVDLGLSVYWADCNIGASSPEEFGDYFSFGEIEPKERYDWSTYKWGDRLYPTKFTKYYASDIFPPGTVDSQGSIMDGKRILEPEDDVAYTRLGGKWRMPTHEEMLELVNSCSMAFTSSGGVPGVQVTNLNTGAYIFLPAAGYKSASQVIGKTTRGEYMSSSVSTDNVYQEWGLTIYMPNSYRVVSYTSFYRSVGYSVRAVCDK